MYILGISCDYHEAAAALIKDGAVVAASTEERFTRIKHDPSFPHQAIDFCLSQQRIAKKDLSYVVFYEKPFQKFIRNITISFTEAPESLFFFIESMKNSLSEKLWIKGRIHDATGISFDRILFVPHHLSHAAATFYPSPFTHAAFLTLDGVGEWTTGSWGLAKNTTLYPKKELRYPHSVGLLYSTFTAFLGFGVNDGEYSVMGMAAYGKPVYKDLIQKLFTLNADTSITLDLSYFAFQKSTTAMYTKKFKTLFSTLHPFDIAASLQSVTEDIIFAMMTHIAKKTGEKNLVFGGGVALNSMVNGKITTRTPFTNVFVYPAAGDDGGAVGAALYTYHHVLKYKKRVPLTTLFLGPSYTNDEIVSYLTANAIRYTYHNDASLYRHVVTALTKGKVIGWFDGRGEFGPRALGHRSIFADPKNESMKDIVNSRIKFREQFRPFAPAVLAEYANTYYDIPTPFLTPYMLSTHKTTTKGRMAAKATTHVDGTSRIQTVDSSYDGKFRTLLLEFYKKTGRPILLNTSFNLKGEPIVESPQDAYTTFIKSGLDMLVLGNFILVK